MFPLPFLAKRKLERFSTWVLRAQNVENMIVIERKVLIFHRKMAQCM